MRTYESWTPEQISKKDNIHRAHALFSFAWFHAACQERRNYIPQVYKINLGYILSHTYVLC